jgi:hypothetical protein
VRVWAHPEKYADDRLGAPSQYHRHAVVDVGQVLESMATRETSTMTNYLLLTDLQNSLRKLTFAPESS